MKKNARAQKYLLSNLIRIKEAIVAWSVAHHAPILSHLFSNILLFLEISANSLSFCLFLSFALKNLSFSLQLSRPIVEEPKKEREMASFSEAPPGDPKVGEKIFKTKCAQCHTVDKGAGHKQGIHFFFLLIYLFIYFYIYSIWLRRVWI